MTISPNTNPKDYVYLSEIKIGDELVYKRHNPNDKWVKVVSSELEVV